MYLYRIHIRPYGGTASTEENFEYCREKNVLGIGWRVESSAESLGWTEYEELATRAHGKINACRYIKKWIKPDDLVWTRDTRSNYYLARVTSEWKYWYPRDAVQLGVDIANLFDCEMIRVPIDSVPGKVVACFRSPRVIQEVADERAREYSKFLWNSLVRKGHYSVDAGKFKDVFMMLDDQETEDLVFLFLQSKGWYVVPNSRKADTMSYEFYLVHPKSPGTRAATQVKTGGVTLDFAEFAKSEYNTVYLFQSEDSYIKSESDKVEVINRDELEEFLVDSRQWLPDVFTRKLEMVTGIDRRE